MSRCGYPPMYRATQSAERRCRAAARNEGGRGGKSFEAEKNRRSSELLIKQALVVNLFFRLRHQNGKVGRELSRPAYPKGKETHNSLNLLRRIMVKIGVKVKITIIRK
jgi:hypothetical protein